MLIDCSYGLLQCWTIIFVVSHIVPIVSSNVERSFSSFNAMLNHCSYGLMQCWTTVLVVCHIVPFVWSNVERSFSLSNAMLNDCSYGLILCWTTVLVICYVVPIVWCNYKCFQKKHWHTGYIITIDPPLCVVSSLIFPWPYVKKNLQPKTLLFTLCIEIFRIKTQPIFDMQTEV